MSPTEFRRLKRDQSTAGSSSMTSFFIPDSSPIFAYSGSSDDNNGVSIWTPGFALQSDGYDQTLHLSNATNSSIAFNVSATSLTLLIPSFNNCQASLSINDSSPISACAATSSTGDIPFSLYNLPDGRHYVTWKSGPVSTGDQVIFWGVDGIRQGDGEGMTNVTIDDTYSRTGPVQFGWSGDWTKLAEGTSSNLSEAKGLSNNFNKTLAITQNKDAAVSFTGQGSAVYVYGTLGPDYGSASLTLGGQIVAPHLNLSSPWALPYQLIWFATDLDVASTTDITLTSLEDKKMSLDFVIMTTNEKTLSQIGASSSSHGFISTIAGKLVAFFVIPLVVALLLGVGIFCYCVRKRSRQRRSARESSSTLRPGSTVPYSASGEKRNSVWSSNSSPSLEEVFVSYDQGRGQRLSDRWHASSTSSNGGLRSPDSTSGATGSGSGSASGHSHGRPERPSNLALPTLTETSENGGQTESPSADKNGTWTRPLLSFLGSSYTRSSHTGSRRQTKLPPYTLGNTNTNMSTLTGEYPTAESEKAAQLQNIIAIAGPSRNLDHTQGHSYADNLIDANDGLDARASTVPPSEVMSVFGQPPSERRESAMTTMSSAIPQPFITSSIVPAMRPTPKVNTTMLDRHHSSPQSAVSTLSGPVNSASPLLPAPTLAQSRSGSNSNPASAFASASISSPPSAYSIRETWPVSLDNDDNASITSGVSHRDRKRTLSTRSRVSEAGSAARPDSDVIPFESFIGQLQFERDQ